MGWRFRKSFKLFPGVRVNLGKKGITSVSLEGGGVTTNINPKGVSNSYSISGTGISYQTARTPLFNKSGSSNKSTSNQQSSTQTPTNPASLAPTRVCKTCGASSPNAAISCTSCLGPGSNSINFNSRFEIDGKRLLAGSIILGSVVIGIITAALIIEVLWR